MRNIVSIISKQHLILVLTKAGQAFIYNSFFPDKIERVGEESIRVFKASLLDSSRLVLIYKEDTIRGLKFRCQDYPQPIDSPTPQFLENLLVMNENIEHFDASFNNLVLKHSGKFLVIDVSSQVVKFEGNGPGYIYSHDCVAKIQSNSDEHEVVLVRLSDKSVQSVVIKDCRPLNVIDLFNEYIIFVQAGRLYSIGFGEGDVSYLSDSPPKYFIGKCHSVALFPRHFIIMGIPWSKLEIAAKLICADLVGILIVYEKPNSRLIVIKDNGEQLRSMSLSLNPVHISFNPDTLEILVASKTTIQVLD